MFIVSHHKTEIMRRIDADDASESGTLYCLDTALWKLPVSATYFITSRSLSTPLGNYTDDYNDI